MATDFSVGAASAPSIMGRSETPSGGLSPAQIAEVLAAFLVRMAAYLQSYLPNAPDIEKFVQESLPEQRLTVADSSIDNTTGPLSIVRMNRHLSRRLRWLIKRGHVKRTDEMRVATAEDKARCNLTPGQFIEYCIRVHRWSRVRLYGLGEGGRAAKEKDCVLFLGLAVMCNVLLTPD